MKKNLLILFCVFFIVDLSAQLKPDSYLLPSDQNHLNKITSSTPVSNSISDIVILGDTIIWLGTSRGVSVSYDQGTNWINFYGADPFGSDNVSEIAYDYSTNTLWVATATTASAPGGGTVPKGTGLKYTTDSGDHWTSISQPLDQQSDSTEVYGINTLHALPVTVAENNITYDIAFTQGTVWITSFAAGLRKSTDMGATWQRVVLPPDNLNSIAPTDTLDFCLSPVSGKFCDEGNLNHRVFSVVTTDQNTLYVGTADGINKSTDNGISWVKFNHQNQNDAISGNFITALYYNPYNNTVWGATWKAEEANEFYAISSTTDGGQSWKTFLDDQRTHNFGSKNDQVIAVTDEGAFRTANNGDTWILPTAIIDTVTDPTAKIYLHTKTYYSAASQGNNIIWLGSDDGLIKLNETSLWKGTWKIYFAAEALKGTSTTYCYPNPFSPKQDELKIVYTTNNQPAKVTIRVFDFGMNYIRTIIQNATRQRDINGPPEFWDGRDDKGNLLPNGVYFYRVDIDDNDPLFGKIIYLQ